jgi:hypothetical protein
MREALLQPWRQPRNDQPRLVKLNGGSIGFDLPLVIELASGSACSRSQGPRETRDAPVDAVVQAAAKFP